MSFDAYHAKHIRDFLEAIRFEAAIYEHTRFCCLAIRNDDHFELHDETSAESWVYIAMIRLQLCRLA